MQAAAATAIAAAAATPIAAVLAAVLAPTAPTAPTFTSEELLFSLQWHHLPRPIIQTELQRVKRIFRVQLRWLLSQHPAATRTTFNAAVSTFTTCTARIATFLPSTTTATSRVRQSMLSQWRLLFPVQHVCQRDVQ